MQPAPPPDSLLLQPWSAPSPTSRATTRSSTSSELQRALGLRAEYLARRVMAAFDIDGDGVIRRDEFLEGVRKLVLGSPRDRLLFAFRVHDDDGDGNLDRVELVRMVTLALAEDDVARRDAQVERLVAALLVGRRHRPRRAHVVRGVRGGRRPPPAAPRADDARRGAMDCVRTRTSWPASRRRAGRARRVRRGWSAGWAPVDLRRRLGAGQRRAARAGHAARRRGRATPSDFIAQVSRATTRPIELDGAHHPLPVLRRLLTWVRRTWLGRVVPVDEAVDFHRIVGHTLFALLRRARGRRSSSATPRREADPRRSSSSERALTGVGAARASSP